MTSQFRLGRKGRGEDCHMALLSLLCTLHISCMDVPWDLFPVGSSFTLSRLEYFIIAKLQTNQSLAGRRLEACSSSGLTSDEPNLRNLITNNVYILASFINALDPSYISIWHHSWRSSWEKFIKRRTKTSFILDHSSTEQG